MEKWEKINLQIISVTTTYCCLCDRKRYVAYILRRVGRLTELAATEQMKVWSVEQQIKKHGDKDGVCCKDSRNT